MPRLEFSLKKRTDREAVLVLTREDGTSSVGRIGPVDGYFPVHDLTHYVVESTLGFSEGFLGLVASGWEIADFEIRGASKIIPPEALLAESAAGELSRQEMMQQYSTAEDFVWAVDLVLSNANNPSRMPPLTQETFIAMRAQLAELRARWVALPPGETLTLPFESRRRSVVARPRSGGRH